MKKTLALLLPLLTACVAFAQTSADFTFTAAPTDHQLYPRNGSNQATVTYSGTINWSVPYQYMKLRVYSRAYPAAYPGSPVTTLSVVPTYVNASTRSFSLSYTISGSLTDYYFQFGYTHNSTDTYFKSAQDVVAGDVFIVTGQSNSIAQGLNATDDDSYVDHYARAYGMYYDDAVQYCNANSLTNEPAVGGWGEADAYSNAWLATPVYSPHFAGITGLKFAQSIIAQQQVPVAIINGGAGGQEIAAFLSTAGVPSNYSGQTTYSLYNFLKQKTINAGVQNNIKAIVWYQGEADAVDQTKTCNYDDNFQALHTSWNSDYASVQRIYMMQINTMRPTSAPSCTTYTTLWPYFNDMHGAELRNMQRLTANNYSDVTLVPTVGNAAADRSCDEVHYSVAGYARNGLLLFKLMSKQLYGSSYYTDDQVYAPALFGITYTGNVIKLEYLRNITFQSSYAHPNGTTYYLKNHFFDQNNNPVSIASISASGKFLSLTLSTGQSMPTKLTYLPSHEYFNNSAAGADILYAGPWITSSDQQLGVASFYQVSVGADFTAGAPACSGSNITVAVSSPVVTGLSHLYQVWAYDATTGHFTGSPYASTVSTNSGTLTLPGAGTYVITHGTWSSCQPWQFTELVCNSSNLANFTMGTPVCSSGQTQLTCTAITASSSSSWKTFTADAAGNITNSTPVQTFTNVSSCTFTNLTPETYYVIEHKSWGGCVPGTHTSTQHVFIPSTVSLNSGITNLSVGINSSATSYIIVTATAAASTPGSYWDIRQSDMYGTLTSTVIGSSQGGGSCSFTGSSTSGYALYRGQYYLLVHGVWGGCSGWTWTGALVYVAPRMHRPEIVYEVQLDASSPALTNTRPAAPGVTPLTGETLDVWPNPVAGDALFVAAENTALTSVTLLDMTGRVIRTVAVQGSTIELNIGDLAPGVYLVQCTDENGVVHTQKFVREQ